MANHYSVLDALLGIVIGVLILILFYHICKGIEERAFDRGLPELARQAMNRWMLLLVFECSVMVVPFIANINVKLAGILGLIVFVLATLVIILLMALMKTAKESISTRY